MNLTTIPARRGKAAFAPRGSHVHVVNTHGSQVVDTWAFVREDLREFMSMEHTRAHIVKLVPVPGDALLTNHRRPILTLLEDTSGGVHDTLIAACDRWRYQLLGAKGPHDNCTDNLAQAMHDLGLEAPETPSPLNLFMNIPWTALGRLSFEPPVSTPRSYVRFRAELDCVVAFSACPQDMIPINGRDLKPTEAHFAIEY
ncbi:MAG: urea carboxylase-associated family protein [Alphaproteobacteria bacterium]|nr:urea carboxylase-associated family protein [Alphaproteobacteria bacterium]